MRKIKVILDFPKFPVFELIEFGANSVSKMTGNPTVPSPVVPLATMTTSLNTLTAAAIAADGGGPKQTADLRIARKAVVTNLRKNAAYVDQMADGNDSIILGAGFHTTHQPTPVERPVFMAERGKFPGDMVLKHKAITGAKAYVWQFCIHPSAGQPGTDWTYAGVSTQSKYTISGLTKGVTYMFRCTAVKPTGMLPWCDPIEKEAY